MAWPPAARARLLPRWFNLINPETGNRIRMITQDAETGKEVERLDLIFAEAAIVSPRHLATSRAGIDEGGAATFDFQNLPLEDRALAVADPLRASMEG